MVFPGRPSESLPFLQNRSLGRFRPSVQPPKSAAASGNFFPGSRRGSRTGPFAHFRKPSFVSSLGSRHLAGMSIATALVRPSVNRPFQGPARPLPGGLS